MGIHSIMTYNANGSITSLLRNGMKNDGTFGPIDDLTITYDGNRLLKVTMMPKHLTTTVRSTSMMVITHTLSIITTVTVP